MLTTSFASLIATKLHNDTITRNRTEARLSGMAKCLADNVKVERINRMKAIDDAIAREKAEEAERKAEAKVRNERKIKARLRNERDMLIVSILAMTVVGIRKDGSRYMRAKPGMADEVKAAQAKVELLNKSIRPEHGYPCPPPRRSEAYPQGGLWGKPSNMTDIECKQGERDRLMQYCKTCYNAERDCVQVEDGEVGKVVSLQGVILGGITLEGKTFVACPSNTNEPITTHKTYTEALAFIAISPRVRRMMNQLTRLDRQIKNMASETNVRRTDKHCYTREIDSRETI